MYELSLFYQNGSCHAILKDVFVTPGYIQGTRVGTINGFDAKGNIIYRECQPHFYVASGTFTLVEYRGKLEKA